MVFVSIAILRVRRRGWRVGFGFGMPCDGLWETWGIVLLPFGCRSREKVVEG